MDKIIIKDLEVDAHIGVTETERAQAQRLLITVEMERDLTEAGRLDAETSTTRYDIVADMIRKIVSDRPRKLVEAVAHEIAEAILARQMARTVDVEVKKFSIPRSQYVSIQIRRSQ
jgi:dihydroneopterin aldolase